MQVQSYLFFNGNCEEAVDFYKQALGARVDMLMRYKEAPEPPPPGMVPPNWDNKVMHTSFWIGESMVMASDGCESDGASAFKGFSLSITAKDEPRRRRSSTRSRPAARSRCRSTRPSGRRCFGMLTDKFGVNWMVGVFVPPQ